MMSCENNNTLNDSTMHTSTRSIGTFLLSDSEEEYPIKEPKRSSSMVTAETEVDSLLLGEAYFFDEPAWETFQTNGSNDDDDNETSNQGIGLVEQIPQPTSTTTNTNNNKHYEYVQTEEDGMDAIKDSDKEECTSATPIEEDEDSDPAYLEVAPGLNLRLRDSDETMQAVKIGFITCSRCLCCGDFLHSIQDADYVFCYDCGVVNPVALCQSTNESSVGIGMKDNELVEAIVNIYGRKRAP